LTLLWAGTRRCPYAVRMYSTSNRLSSTTAFLSSDMIRRTGIFLVGASALPAALLVISSGRGPCDKINKVSPTACANRVIDPRRENRATLCFVIRGSGVRIPQPAPNCGPKSNTCKHATNISIFLATNFSYQNNISVRPPPSERFRAFRARCNWKARPRPAGVRAVRARTRRFLQAAVQVARRAWLPRNDRGRHCIGSRGRQANDLSSLAIEAAVVLEALTARTAAEVVAPDTGSVQEDVRVLLRSAFHMLRVGRQKVVVTLMAEAQLNDDFADAFRERFRGLSPPP